MPDNIKSMPNASHANAKEMLNALRFHKSAINDAVEFACSCSDPSSSLPEVASRWGYFGLFELEVFEMMVTAVLNDRIKRSE